MHTGNTLDSTTFDKMLEALGSRPRRRLLVALLEEAPRRVPRAGEKTVPDWAVGLDGEVSERFRMRLYHKDLPKLDRLGHVEWDREAGLVERGERFDEIRLLVEILVANEAELPNDLR